MTDSLLEVEDLCAGYGHIDVLHGASLEAPRGKVTCLVGSNGAGKTTLLRSLAGQHRVASGRVRFDGEEIQRMRSHKVARRGIGLVPEGRRVFASLTTLQNLQMGAFSVRGGWRSPEGLARVLEIFPELRKVERQPAGLLSGGEQQMLATGRALMGRPRMLILDEPSMGLAPKLVERIYEALSELKAAGTTILLAEQNARLALRLSDWAYVLESGRVAEHGRAEELQNSSRVEEIYLGG